MPITKTSIERAKNRAMFEQWVALRLKYQVAQRLIDRRVAPSDDFPTTKDKDKP